MNGEKLQPWAYKILEELFHKGQERNVIAGERGGIKSTVLPGEEK